MLARNGSNPPPPGGAVDPLLRRGATRKRVLEQSQFSPETTFEKIIFARKTRARLIARREAA
jgi:hypothetical protein